MYGVVEIGGKQYFVEPGLELIHEVLPGVPVGARVTFDRVLLLRNGERVEVGTPYLAGVRVVGEVQEIGKLPKVIIFKYTPKKGYRRKKGHRQPFMRTKILEIVRS
ncbi:MAG: 50S ribosomal protein L21 [Candidatus Bipolaricaulota bacterium]|nr:50S ribosomal protein L21 [Candidatus Bipolaricaulota bacterium]MCX7844130.1 50S ribosomal protein L21 [Candidatus Bipolaricaulota bacterium]MDW8152281.1 50S ribosomal protein L21 [Candidatus Bipolaricaulota bacterium]